MAAVVVATLFYYRHNCSQEVTGVVFGVSQPTISRIVNAPEEPIAAVLDREVPELVEVVTGRVVIPDGTLGDPTAASPTSRTGRILSTGWRRPLRKLAICLAAVTALEFYRLNWASSK